MLLQVACFSPPSPLSHYDIFSLSVSLSLSLSLFLFCSLIIAIRNNCDDDYSSTRSSKNAASYSNNRKEIFGVVWDYLNSHKRGRYHWDI